MKNGWRETCLNCIHFNESEWLCEKHKWEIDIHVLNERACCELKHTDKGPLYKEESDNDL